MMKASRFELLRSVDPKLLVPCSERKTLQPGVSFLEVLWIPFSSVFLLFGMDFQIAPKLEVSFRKFPENGVAVPFTTPGYP